MNTHTTPLLTRVSRKLNKEVGIVAKKDGLTKSAWLRLLIIKTLREQASQQITE